jgi:hypothetical protein
MGSISPPSRKDPRRLFDEITTMLAKAQKAGNVIDPLLAADSILFYAPGIGFSREEIARAILERCVHLTGIGVVLGPLTQPVSPNEPGTDRERSEGAS